jgi:WD40 repeat protein
MLPVGVKSTPTVTCRCGVVASSPPPSAADASSPARPRLVGSTKSAAVGKPGAPCAGASVTVAAGLSKGTVVSCRVNFSPELSVTPVFVLEGVGGGADISALDAVSVTGPGDAVTDPPVALVAGTTIGDIIEIFSPSASETPPLSRVVVAGLDGVVGLHCFPLLTSSGGTNASQCALALLTRDSSGTIALYEVPVAARLNPLGDATTAGTVHEPETIVPACERRIQACSLSVTRDGRYALCGVPKVDAALMPTAGASAPGEVAPRGRGPHRKTAGQTLTNDVLVLDLATGVSALRATPTPAAPAAPDAERSKRTATRAARNAAAPGAVTLNSLAAFGLPSLVTNHSSAADGSPSGCAPVTAVSQSHNRLVLLCGLAAGDVAMVDFSNFVKPDRIEFHKGSTVAALAIAGGGRFGVSASEDTTLRVWELLTGRPLSVIDAHVGRVWSVTALRGFTAPGAATDTADTGDASLLARTQSGAQGSLVLGAAGKRQGSSAAMQISSSAAAPIGAATIANWIASGAEDGTMRVHALPSGKLIETHEADSECVWSVASDDGFVCTGGSDGSVRVWALATRKQALIDRAAGRSGAAAREHGTENLEPQTNSFVSFAGRGKPIVAAPAKGSSSTFAPCGILKGHTAAVTAITTAPFLLPSGERVTLAVSASFDTTIRVWELNRQVQVAVLSGHTDVVWSLTSNAAFHPSSRGGPSSAPTAATAGPSEGNAADDGDGAPASSPANQSQSDVIPQVWPAAGSSGGAAPLVVYSASEDKTLRAWHLDVAACITKADAEHAAGGSQIAGTPSPAVAGMKTHSLVATLNVEDAAASVVALGPCHVAVGTAHGELMVVGMTSLAKADKKAQTGSSYATKEMCMLSVTGSRQGVHHQSLCALAASKHCLLTGGVDGIVRYHDPWPALKAQLENSPAADATTEGQKVVRLVTVHAFGDV